MIDYSYEEMIERCRRGETPSCAVRAASGRLNLLLGLGRAQLRRLRRAARSRRVGLLLLGSRVSGPRLRQRTLHPALASLPLKTTSRHASALRPGVDGIEIEKTRIKEFGVDDPRTSDLTVLLIDTLRSPEQVDALAAELEAEFGSLGVSFPLRFLPRWHGQYFRSEEDYLAMGRRYLRALPGAGDHVTEKDLRHALGELYTTINLPRTRFISSDLGNGLAGSTLFSLSFSRGMPFHPVYLLVGFGFGFFGRYLARYKAWIAFSLGDGLWANAAAVAADAGIGAAVMALILNPVAGLGLSLRGILAASLLHSSAKGSLRVFIDKIFSVRPAGSQALGVLIGLSLSSLQVMVTSFVYAGSLWAIAVQAGTCLTGVVLLFGPALRRSRLFQTRRPR